MSVTETVLTYVGIPAVVVLLVAGLGYAGKGTTSRRYRPGRPFDFTPVWFLSSPEQLSGSAGVALPSGPQTPAVTSGEVAQQGKVPLSRTGVTGGASDRW